MQKSQRQEVGGGRGAVAEVGLRLATAGAAACFADAVTFPLDTAKVRLQVQGGGGGGGGDGGARAGAARRTTARVVAATVAEGGGGGRPQYRGIFGTIATIARQEGARSLYGGLNAGLQRQLCFASVRLGLYEPVKGLYQRALDGDVGSAVEAAGSGQQQQQVGVPARVAAGLTTGALAVLVAQPTDVVKVRMQAQRILRPPRPAALGVPGALAAAPAPARRASTLSAYKNIAAREGARGLWRGTFPNVSRNAIVNVSEIVCYDIIKDAILERGLMANGTPCHFVSAVIAGLCTTVVASPVDVVKTRYMSTPSGEYAGVVDCAARLFAAEGAAAFYKGFAPSFCRLVSWNIVMWVSYEKLKQAILETPR